MKTALKTAVRLAKLPGKITPHTLRHTAATWLMQNGVDKWEATGFLGMSVEMLDRVYGHHHPEHLRGAAHALGAQVLVCSMREEGLAANHRPRHCCQRLEFEEAFIQSTYRSPTRSMGSRP